MFTAHGLPILRTTGVLRTTTTVPLHLTHFCLLLPQGHAYRCQATGHCGRCPCRPVGLA